MKKSIILAVVGSIIGASATAQTSKTLTERVRAYTQSDKAKIYTLQAMSALAEGAISYKLFRIASQFSIDTKSIRALESDLKGKNETLAQIDQNLERYGKVAQDDPGFEAAQTVIATETDQKNALLDGIRDLKGEIAATKGNFILRNSIKGIKIASVGIGLVLIADIGTRAYYIYMDGTDPGLFPVLEVAAGGLDRGGIDVDKIVQAIDQNGRSGLSMIEAKINSVTVRRD